MNPSSSSAFLVMDAARQAPPTDALRTAAWAAAAMADAFERRPGRGQPPGPVSLLLSTRLPRARFPGSHVRPRLSAAALRIHDADDVPAEQIDLLAANRLRRSSAAETRRRLVEASDAEDGPLVAYAQPGLALVVPRMAAARATVVGDPARLRRYARARTPAAAAIAAARAALEDALASDWPAADVLWQAPDLRSLSAHGRMAALAALPGAVGPALARYNDARNNQSPITAVRTGGLLLLLAPRPHNRPGLRLVDVRRP
jgi:hypothetical protein